MNYVFVGGTADHRIQDVEEYRNEFNVRLRPKVPYSPLSDSVQDEVLTIKHVTYTRRRFRTPEGVFQFFAHVELTDIAALQMVFDYYSGKDAEKG
jgi:hypothetical protein